MVIRGGEIKTNKLSNLLDKFEPSPNLKDEFEKFKSNLENSELVVAFPGAFFFIGEHAVMFGHPALYMTIPLYVLIGIKESTKEGINIEVWQRNPETNFFEKFKWAEISQREELRSKIEELFIGESIKPRHDVFTLMQVPPSCGLNSSGAFSAGISVCLGMLKGYLTPEKIEDWQSVKELSNLKKDKEFNKTFKIAWDIDWIIQKRSSGIGPFASLIGVRDEPIVYFLEKSVNNRDKKPEWFAYLFSEIYDKSEIKWIRETPIALIYSGSIAFTKRAFEKIQDETFAASTLIPVFS
jgi:hypothetical protein